MEWKDKLQHSVVCAAIVIVGVKFSLALGIILALTFSFMKEFNDSLQPDNKWDWDDILADLFGIAIGWILTL